jgi:hypothetical protein
LLKTAKSLSLKVYLVSLGDMRSSFTELPLEERNSIQYFSIGVLWWRGGSQVTLRVDSLLEEFTLRTADMLTGGDGT